MNDSSGRYYSKNTADGQYADLTETFDGLAILKVDGLFAKGKAVNVYTAQWTYSQEEDFMVTGGGESPQVIRENTDVDVTFIIRSTYASGNIDVATVHDAFVSYMTGGDVWIRSGYSANKAAHCVCLSEYKPTTVKLGRGSDSYIIGTIKLHCLDAPSQ